MAPSTHGQPALRGSLLSSQGRLRAGKRRRACDVVRVRYKRQIPSSTNVGITMPDDAKLLQDTLAERFGERILVDPNLAGLAELAAMAGHRSYRRFLPRPVSFDTMRLLCACALSAPSK